MCPVPWGDNQCGRQGTSMCSAVRVSVRPVSRGSLAGPEGGGMWLPSVVKNMGKTWVQIPAV